MPENHGLPTSRAETSSLDRINWVGMTPFLLAHLVCFAAIWTGVSWVDIAIFAGLYALRMFGITGVYHRYFSHRSFKANRVVAFILGFIAQSSAQRGVLWWAANHRHHHRHSDTLEDVHSPIHKGFWYSHLGWFFTPRYAETDMEAVPDLAKYPELVWLDRHPYLPAVLLGLVTWALAGWSGLIVGFFWSTVALWHATFSINSLAHVVGRKRYLTGDQSRNNWWLALLTFGEGWHNNHHHFQSAARQGFFWYEVDFSYYTLKVMSWARLVSDLKRPPQEVVTDMRRLGRGVIERAAQHLAAKFDVQNSVAELQQALAQGRERFDASIEGLHGWQAEMPEMIERWKTQLAENRTALSQEIDQLVHGFDLSALPSTEDLRKRAQKMFARHHALPEVVQRAQEILIERLTFELERKVPVPVRATQK